MEFKEHSAIERCNNKLQILDCKKNSLKTPSLFAGKSKDWANVGVSDVDVPTNLVISF